MKKYTIKLILLILIFFSYQNSHSQVGRWRMLIDKATFDVAVNPKNYNTIYAGGEGGNFYRSYDGGLTWTNLRADFTFQSSRLNNVIPHPEDTNRILIGGLLFGKVQMTTNQGNTWKTVLTSETPIELNGKSMHFKPGSKDTVYAGDVRRGVIYRSIDGGSNWDSISVITRKYRYRNQSGEWVSAILPSTIGAFNIRTDSANIIVVGSMSGEVFISTDGGFTWNFTDQLTKIIYPPFDKDCEVTRVVFSDRDPRVGYIVITYLIKGNFPNGGLHKTTDGGYNWDLVAFPDTSLWACDTRKFGDEDEVFIGGYTEHFFVPESQRVPGAGILRGSQDGGKTWANYDNLINWAIDSSHNASLFGMHFPSNDTGFVVGEKGRILRTRDGGNNWSDVDVISTNTLKTVYFLDGRKGFLAGENGLIMSTENGGITWKNLNSGVTDKINNIKFTNFNSGFAVCDNGTILKTTDSGNNWFKLNSGTNENLFCAYFLNDNIVFASGNNGVLLKTVDGGNNWQRIDLQRTDSLNSIYFTDSKTGYICGQNGLILKTTDGGDNWQALDTQTNLGLYSIHFPTKSIGFAGGVKGLIFKTTDEGDTWTSIETEFEGRTIYSLHFSNENYGTIAGHLFSLSMTTNSGKTWENKRWGYNHISNMWSFRFFGEPGREKLYLASEAGLFVLDYSTDIDSRRLISKDGYLKIYLTKDNYLFLKYHRNDYISNEFIKFRIVDIMGREVYSKQFFNTNSNDFESFIKIPNLVNGVYICQLFDKDLIFTEKIIIE
ncbi:MAG: YCF48-related protein [Candidatus Kapabacteria bacterium]|nr:YCF48-related protein [Candidatus Kapabacteria bacterium]